MFTIEIAANLKKGSTLIVASGVLEGVHVSKILAGTRSGRASGNGWVTGLVFDAHLHSVTCMSLNDSDGLRKASPFRSIFWDESRNHIRSESRRRKADLLSLSVDNDRTGAKVLDLRLIEEIAVGL